MIITKIDILRNIQNGQWYPAEIGFIDDYGKLGRELLDDGYLQFDNRIKLTLTGIDYLNNLNK
jgi:hypothetical protein